MWHAFPRWFVAGFIGWGLVPASGWSQVVHEPGTVVAAATASVKQKPSLLRMTIQLQEKAPNIKDALKQLGGRRDAALLVLQQLGADKKAVTVAEPTLSAGETDQERQLQRMMFQQMRARGRAAKALQVPKSVTVSSTITAEWPLTLKTNDELLVFVESLQSKIEVADLAGLKEPKKLTPEEEELKEEMAQMMEGYGGYDSGQPQPGVPVFVYVARLANQDRDRALADAFAKAKGQAERLAVAAGAKLGKLASISGMTSQAAEDYSYGVNSYAVRMMMNQAASSGSADEEVVVPQPGLATFQVMVNATFRLE